MLNLRTISPLAFVLLALAPASPAQIPAFPLAPSKLVISRPTQPAQPFTVAGPRGVLVGTQDGQFESWILPIKLLSHLTIEASLEGYSVPIDVNPQSANIEVRPDRTTITYSHIAFTLRQIMFSPDQKSDRVPQVPTLGPGKSGPGNLPSTGPVVLFQIDAPHPLDLTFRFTPEMRWMWPKRNDGIPSAEWVKISPSQENSGVPQVSPSGTQAMRVPQVPPLGPGSDASPSGYYVLHMDYPDLAGAVTIPTATPGILAPYQERPQVHPLELHLHYDPKRDGAGAEAKYFPLLMAAGTTKETASAKSLGESLANLNASIPEAYKAHAASYEKLLAESTSIETPDKALNEAFQWGIVSIEQLKAHEYSTNQDALVAGYYASGDSARPGFGWFFGRDSLYTLYAINGYGDFALTRAELEFLIARQRADGKIMHEYSQTAGDPVVDWKSFPYMYAAADATPLFLMAMRDYYRASGDLAFLQKHKEVIEKAWAFETAPTSDTDHDGIYDNSQGTGWVESWPHDRMPHQEIYLALLDEQASWAYAEVIQALDEQGGKNSESVALTPFASPKLARRRALEIQSKIESEYYDPAKGCYAFSHNLPGDPNGETDKATTVYPAIAWWDYNPSTAESIPEGAGAFRPLNQAAKSARALAPEEKSVSPGSFLAHAADCLKQFNSPTLATDWGLRDVATTEPFYDGMSYHQGSVWPLFTGWAALAEYRANQPLAGEQMLMQNVDLTWAQDPGAVTELLSGDYFVPFGRSTSHQLWSSAMVLTPTLRGLFGISLDAANNTITVNPHLPAGWDRAEIHGLRVGEQRVRLIFTRDKGTLRVSHLYESNTGRETSNVPFDRPSSTGKTITLRSDIPDSKVISVLNGHAVELTIPLPRVEASLSDHLLPIPGSRSSQIKILSAEYAPHQLKLELAGHAGSAGLLYLRENEPVKTIQMQSFKEHDQATVRLFQAVDLLPPDPSEKRWYLEVHFPQGEGWQTTQVTLTW